MFDPRDDFADVADGLEPVTLVRPGSSAAEAVPHALRRAVAVREAAVSAGRYTTADVAWHLPAAELADPPRPGDAIIDASGGRWTVLEVRLAAQGGRWRCVARDLAVAAGLDSYVDIEQAEYGKGEAGADAPAWHVWKTGLRARIQPVESRVETAEGRQATSVRYVIYLAEDVAVGHAHRLRGPDGAVYTVLAARKPARVDALVEIEASRQT
jgi:hypothetical protein